VTPVAVRLAGISVEVDGHVQDAPTASGVLAGQPITLVSRATALATLKRLLATRDARTRWVCFLNSHTFNSAMRDRDCMETLRGAAAVFPDGIAIRVAARLCGLRVQENLAGTDLVPELLARTRGRCFLIGDTFEQVALASRELAKLHPGWSVVGYHSGYFRSDAEKRRVVETVNRCKPDLVLLGMGTPYQERFLRFHATELRVPLCICVGGLFRYWSRKLVRAPLPVRRMCLEWLWILVQQPRKFRRYTIGTVLFFSAISRLREQPRTADPAAQ
jgi:N-acetylglucosaminyldiphosphoundecaprenol N-acetyl-beta-D-mannosaminyltransferase